ncbi:hypothetical protein VNO77_27561 [Canavalia gladiata]|uniref:Uncharacterized protein n=1 Tax=Canavalia gladiata TaxID=3824 RepID=A0AAN9Q6K8_CANGL
MDEPLCQDPLEVLFATVEEEEIGSISFRQINRILLAQCGEIEYLVLRLISLAIHETRTPQLNDVVNKIILTVDMPLDPPRLHGCSDSNKSCAMNLCQQRKTMQLLYINL